MRGIILWSVLFSLTFSPVAADFAMAPADAVPSAEPATAQGSEATVEKRAPSPRSAKRRSVTRSHRPGYATGFGSKVPLDFAVRQIVPPRIKVSFGTAADKAALVDWRGGRRWPGVLRDAVRPLGLNVSVHKNEVLIEHEK